MFPLFAMLIFILIAALCLFHVLIVKATAWGFAAWFVILVVYNVTRREPRGNKEERIVPQGLGSDVPVPPQGGDATTPVISPKETRGGGQSNSALLRLMSWTERELNARSARAGESGPSDDRYEPMVSYPMEMEQEL